MIKVADAIVKLLISQKITDVFGYPGGMVIYLMDAFKKHKEHIDFRLSYHEQGAAFEACSYAQTSGKFGVAFATSGPGATNLLTGIAQAYFDSIPVIFITGQVNTNESARGFDIRQRGFQETDITEMAKPICKAVYYVDSAKKSIDIFKEAIEIATSGRKGPVLIDLPMNIQKELIPEPDYFIESEEEKTVQLSESLKIINQALKNSRRPVVILGNGIKNSHHFSIDFVRKFARFKIPFVLSLPAVDLLPSEQNNNFGMIGAYGKRLANIIVNKADLVISLGARLDVRQVGGKRAAFAPNAKVLRVDIDQNELNYHIREDDINVNCDAMDVITDLNISDSDFDKWLDTCYKIKRLLEAQNVDRLPTNDIVKTISEHIASDSIITTDVGQNQIWVAQAFNFKNQQFLTSSSLGSMGYSLPASIGAYYGSCGKKNIISFNGDGGIQMNIQELGIMARERLPIKVVVFNNEALGMIRAFQEIYFGDYYMTTKQSGFTNPDFSCIAKAYNMDYYYLENLDSNTDYSIFNDERSSIIEIGVKYPTYVYPKLKFGEANDNQIPYLDERILNEIRSL